MMGKKIEFSPSDKITFTLDADQMRRLLEGPEGPTAKYLAKRVISVERKAIHLCPVDTGRLRASISSLVTEDAKGLLGIVGTNVEYAIFVEFGTRHMSAQPFLRPALGI